MNWFGYVYHIFFDIYESKHINSLTLRTGKRSPTDRYSATIGANYGQLFRSDDRLDM